MISQLLRQEPNFQVHQQPRNYSPASHQSPYQSDSSLQQVGSRMAASAATTPAMDVRMENQDDNRADLPRPYKCPMCDKAFHRLEHQTRHIRTHTGEKPHACQFPGCTKRFSRSDELTRHSRIHNNPNSRRGNKQHAAAAQAAAAAIQGGMYDNAAFQPVHQIGQMNGMHHMNHMSPTNQQTLQGQANFPSQMPPMKQELPRSPIYQPLSMQPPPSMSQTTQSAPGSQLNSPNVSPPHTHATNSSNPGSYMTRNVSGEISPAHGAYHRPLDISLLASAASQVERESNGGSQLPNSQLSLPSGPHYHHNSPYHIGRMPSLSNYHFSSNPASQPMSRSQSDEDQFGQRAAKRSKPGSPHSNTPPSPEFPHESTSPTPDHTPLATPSHSPRLRPQFFHNGVHLPTLNHLTLQNQPPPALAPVEPSADGQQPYVPAQHSGLRFSEIMEAGDGAARKLPIPMVAAKEGGYTKINDLINPESGPNSGRGSEAGNDLHDRN